MFENRILSAADKIQNLKNLFDPNFSNVEKSIFNIVNSNLENTVELKGSILSKDHFEDIVKNRIFIYKETPGIFTDSKCSKVFIPYKSSDTGKVYLIVSLNQRQKIVSYYLVFYPKEFEKLQLVKELGKYSKVNGTQDLFPGNLLCLFFYLKNNDSFSKKELFIEYSQSSINLFNVKKHLKCNPEFYINKKELNLLKDLITTLLKNFATFSPNFTKYLNIEGKPEVMYRKTQILDFLNSMYEKKYSAVYQTLLEIVDINNIGLVSHYFRGGKETLNEKLKHPSISFLQRELDTARIKYRGPDLIIRKQSEGRSLIRFEMD